MAHATLPNQVKLEYETFGRRADPAIILIAGFGAQMVSWPSGFCTGLAGRGRFVIRFDNRDTGLSTTFDDDPVDLGELIAAASRGDIDALQTIAPYRLADLADDAVELGWALGLDRAHVVGASMGGMVAQMAAIRHPEFVASLTSMMSSTGSPEFGQSTPEAFAALMAPVPTDRDGYVAASVAASEIWSSRRYFDRHAAALLAGAAFDRGLHPGGTARHLAAILATGSIEDDLARLQVPTLVIHGTDDTLITPSGGRRTAEVIPGAQLMMVADMGHDRPEPLWPVLWDAIEAQSA